MTSLGSSLAHGVAKRSIREDSDSFWKGFERALAAKIPGKNSRSAYYRYMCNAVNKTVADTLILKQHYGKNQKGTDKKAKTIWYSWVAFEEMYGLQEISIRARDPQIEVAELCWITHHGVARIFQTYNCRSITEFSQKYLGIAELDELKELKVLYFMGMRSENTSLLLGDAEIIIGFSREVGVLIKTAISFSAMNPSKAQYFRNEKRRAGKDTVFIPPLS